MILTHGKALRLPHVRKRKPIINHTPLRRGIGGIEIRQKCMAITFFIPSSLSTSNRFKFGFLHSIIHISMLVFNNLRRYII